MATTARDVLAIQAIADRLQPTLKRQFLAAVVKLRGRVSVESIARAIERGELTVELSGALSAWPQDLRSAVRTMNQVFASSAVLTAKRLSDTLKVSTSFDLVNPLALEAADTRTALLVREVTAETRRGIQAAIREAIASGQASREAAKVIRPLIGLTERQTRAVMNYQLALLAGGGSRARAAAAAKTYAAKLLNRRAITIARTETIRASTDGQLEIWRRAQAQGLIGDVKKRWIVTPDDRLCFVAGTLVSTPSGQRPIESIKAGDIVTTHLGDRPVRAAFSRPTRSQIVHVATAAGSAIATADHPYLVIRGGVPEWCLAGSLKQGDLVCQIQGAADSQRNANGSHLRLRDPYDTPTLTREVCVLSRVPLLVPVPVVAVSLQRDATSLQQEVNAVSPDSCLLSEGNPAPFEFLSNAGFEFGFSSVATVASKGAELALLFGPTSEPRLAGRALGVDGRTAAFLGAEAVLPTLGRESLYAPGAVDVLGLGPSAFERAHGVSVSDDRCYRERLFADTACLRDLVGCACSEITGPLTEAADPLVDTVARLEAARAVSARQGIGMDASGTVVAGGGAVPIVCLGDCISASDADPHSEAILSRPTLVYSLEIEDAHTFFAGGVLVHNCPQCQELAGVEVPLGALFPGNVQGPPLHPNCRCSVRLAKMTVGRRRAA